MDKKRIINVALAFAGIVLIGTGVAFNASAALGNDPVGIVYDGIRSAVHFSPEQLGMASNFVNIVLIIAIFFMERRYVNIGTFIYIIPYGFVVDMGTRLYHAIGLHPFAGAAAGCLLLYMGVAMYITADIGLDPFTGLVMVIRDRTEKEFRAVKVCFDVGCIVLGFALGGKLGVITVLTAVTAGPAIQFLAGGVERFMKRTGG